MGCWALTKFDRKIHQCMDKLCFFLTENVNLCGRNKIYWNVLPDHILWNLFVDAWLKDPPLCAVFSASCLATNFVPTLGPEEVSLERFEDHGKAGCLSHWLSSSFWTTDGKAWL